MLNTFRQALRRIVRQPGFGATVVLTLALGIGATTAVFSLVNGVLLTALPFEEPDRLAMIWEQNLPREVEQNVTSPANFLAWREDAGSFERLAGVVQFGGTLVEGGVAERVGRVQVSWPFFEMLGVRAELGRGFAESDAEGGGPVPVVLSHGFWQRRFGGDPEVVGRAVTLSGQSAEIVGVLPAGFDFDYLEFQFGWDGPQEVWSPIQWPEGASTARGRYLQVLGRLAPGVSAAVGRTRFAMTVLLAFAGIALLLAAIGIYGVISYSVGQRAHEFGVRMTLGAKQADVLRQVLRQGVVMVAVALVVGGGVALAGMRLLQGLIFAVSPTDAVTFLATGTVLAAVALLAAWIPARRAAGTDPMRALRLE